VLAGDQPALAVAEIAIRVVGWMVAGLLHVTHGEYLAAKMRAKELADLA
jgi:hypothetical protein